MRQIARPTASIAGTGQAASMNALFRNRRTRSTQVDGQPDLANSHVHIPRGVPRWRRVGRALWRSPLIRIALSLSVIAQVRGSYVQLRAQQAAWGQSVSAAVATRARETGDILRADDFRWVRLPRAAVPTSAPGRSDEIVGRRLRSAVDIGEVITATRLTAAKTSMLRARTGEGNVAVPIVMRDVDAVVVVGDLVDLADGSGEIVASRAEVVRVQDKQITVSLPATQLRRLALALSGPITVALVGADTQ